MHVANAYKERLFEVTQGEKRMLVPKSTPIWKFVELLRRNGYLKEKQDGFMVLEEERKVLLSSIRYTALLEEFREYCCVI